MRGAFHPPGSVNDGWRTTRRRCAAALAAAALLASCGAKTELWDPQGAFDGGAPGDGSAGDGRDGRDGRDGADGIDGAEGTDGVDGRDGADATDAPPEELPPGPPAALCPPDTRIPAGSETLLAGRGLDDGVIVSYRWRIVSAPPAHGVRLLDATTPAARFVTSATDAGAFMVRFTVTDDDGLEGSCEVKVVVGGAPLAICPADLSTPTRRDVTLAGNADDDGAIVSWRWECTSWDAEAPPVIAAPDARDTLWRAGKPGRFEMRLTVRDDDGLSDSCDFTVTAVESPPTAICPPDVSTRPLVPVELTGDGEDDGTITGWAWELVGRPAGSSAAPPAPAAARVTRFTPDIAGEYRVRLTVTDDRGRRGSCELTVRAASGEGLRVELYWNPPGYPEDGSDVDLHLLHPSAAAWFNERGDCYYANCDSRYFVLDWDAAGTGDNPRLDLDDIDGYGPENINVLAPVTGHVYTVGVHYYDNQNWGDSQVYVKIYCGVVSIDPVYQVGPKVLHAAGAALPANDFWKVAEVRWTGYTCAVTPVDAVMRTDEAMAHR